MRSIAIALLLAAAASAPAADLTLRQKTTTSGGRGTTQREDTVYLTSSILVVDGERDRTIVDVRDRTVTLADKTEKTWFAVTADQLRGQAEAVQEEMKRQMPDMPPEARAAMERMLRTAQAEATVTPTGRHETIAGYDAAEFRVTAGELSGAVWASERVPVPAGLAQWKDLTLGGPSPQGGGRGLAQALARIPGFPLRTTLATGDGPGAMRTSTEVLEVREAVPPAGATAVPEGFRKVDPPTMGTPPA